MKFISAVWRGNNQGAGFVTIPKKFENKFEVNAEIKVSCKGISFYSRIKVLKKRKGFYISKEKYQKLASKKIMLSVNKIDGFCSLVGRDGRIYLPNHIAESVNLSTNDIIFIKGGNGGKIREKYCQVQVRNRKGKKEYRVAFDPSFSMQLCTFSILRKLPREADCSDLIKCVTKDMNIAQLSCNESVLFSGNMWPVIINTNFNIKDIAYYLGAYFSDGLKKGFNWGITASTFEQARFYLDMHRRLFQKSNARAFLTFTTQNVNNKVKKDLARRWNREVDIKVKAQQVRLVKTMTKEAGNRNEFGALTIREGRQLMLKYYLGLLDTLFETVKQDRKSGLDFICGVLEGDGCVNACNRGHVSIASNESEKQGIVDVLNAIGIKYNVYREGLNKYTVRIGALEIIKNFLYLKDRIFMYYPKRRKRFVERFCNNVGAVRFLLGTQKHVAAWVKAWMVKEGILGSNYTLTSYGKEIKNCLIDMRDSINIR